jgi:hypothetical protein
MRKLFSKQLRDISYHNISAMRIFFVSIFCVRTYCAACLCVVGLRFVAGCDPDLPCVRAFDPACAALECCAARAFFLPVADPDFAPAFVPVFVPIFVFDGGPSRRLAEADVPRARLDVDRVRTTRAGSAMRSRFPGATL